LYIVIKMFKKGNKYGRSETPITAIQQQQIEQMISLGYGYLKISKVVGISPTKIKSLGYKTNNKKDKRKRITKDSCVNPSEIDSYVDMSDITFRSLIDANKHKRVLKFAYGYSIKMAILTNGNKVVIQLSKVKTTGESKELWSNILTKALSENYKNIAIDTNAKYTDTHLNLYHLVKDSNHPYNQVVESKIGNLKRAIYRNIAKIRLMDIDEAIEFIYKLAKIQYENKLPIEIIITQ